MNFPPPLAAPMNIPWDFTLDLNPEIKFTIDLRDFPKLLLNPEMVIHHVIPFLKFSPPC